MAKKLYEVTINYTYYCLAETAMEARLAYDRAACGVLDKHMAARLITHQEPIPRGFKNYALYGYDIDDVYLGEEMKKLPKKKGNK